MKTKKKLQIIADGSMIALVNTATYNATLHFQESWSWKQVHAFLLKTNRDNLVIFGTAWEDEWNIEVRLNDASDRPCHRKFEQYIAVTANCLHLVSWSDLTSTLQFEDTVLPAETNEDLRISLSNGFYKVIVKQLFDTGDDEYDPEGKVNYVLELFGVSQIPDLGLHHVVWTEDLPKDDSLFLSNEPNEFDAFLAEFIKRDQG